MIPKMSFLQKQLLAHSSKTVDRKQEAESIWEKVVSRMFFSTKTSETLISNCFVPFCPCPSPPVSAQAAVHVTLEQNLLEGDSDPHGVLPCFLVFVTLSHPLGCLL